MTDCTIEECQRFARLVEKMTPRQKHLLNDALDDLLAGRCTMEEVKSKLEAEWDRIG
jgi:hypothetical protein